MLEAARMTATPETASAPTPSTLETIAVYLRPRVLIVMFLGFSSGLPLALSGSTLSVWMTEAGVDLGTIGLFALVGTPYTIKFLWAPVVDAIDVPILSALLGRRRGWLVFSQLLLIAAIVFLAFCNPAKAPWLVAFGALLVAIASATQDILVDTFRIESLHENEQAAGQASYVAAYRIGMLASTAGALFLVTGFEDLGFAKNAAWMWGYLAMASFVVIGIVTTLLATEPEKKIATDSEQSAALETQISAFAALLKTRLKVLSLESIVSILRRLSETRIGRAAIGAFGEFLSRDAAFLVLAFIVLYKFCDAFAGNMTAPFVIDLGFSRNDYAAIVKGVGLAATLIGGFAGGAVAMRYDLVTCLWIGAGLQMVSNLVFTWLALVGTNQWALTAAIIAENFTGAIGTVIFVAYLSALCQNPLHTATQFALLTALTAVGRTFLVAPAGYVAKYTGWPLFFVVSSLAAIPGLLLLAWLQQRKHFAELGPTRVVPGDD
jgi:MFS transporter, PAT family, beta-lactamase induction signal transducer AmpG